MTEKSEDFIGISRETYERYPWRTRVRTPVGRVVALAVWVTTCAAFVVGLYAGWWILLGVAVAVWFPATRALQIVGGGVGAIRAADLDERELLLRERALARAHVVMSGVLAGAWAYATTSDGFGLWSATLTALALAHLGLPSVLLAMQARLPDRD